MLGIQAHTNARQAFTGDMQSLRSVTPPNSQLRGGAFAPIMGAGGEGGGDVREEGGGGERRERRDESASIK